MAAEEEGKSKDVVAAARSAKKSSSAATGRSVGRPLSPSFTHCPTRSRSLILMLGEEEEELEVRFRRGGRIGHLESISSQFSSQSAMVEAPQDKAEDGVHFDNER